MSIEAPGSGTVPLDFWSGSIRNRPFREQVDAAAAGGFSRMAVSPENYADTVASGMVAKDMRRYAADRGVAFGFLDSLWSWAPVSGRLDDQVDEGLRRRWATTVDTSLDICDILEVGSIVVCAGYDADTVEQSRLADCFAQLCAKAWTRDLRVEIEPMPFFGCWDVTDAWRLISDAELPRNAGIILDAWHFYRAGSTPEMLASIPGEFLQTLQLVDAGAKPASVSLIDDCMRYRLFPGEGELPLTEFVQAVLAKGHVRSIGRRSSPIVRRR
ncbi:sugar phosphate isomerase/epimerase family protein [Herbiconiux sp. UC225_62]|uniref:sugar phosphate isomerase/epimerase family protein n=1 Tax=Herbiconiux sp. UC225_62 TaxID=3350168 RepID=UPI0036D25F0D